MILPKASRAVSSLSLIIAVSVITSSCQPKAGVEASTVTKAETKTPPPDLVVPHAVHQYDSWERMKECTEQVDRIAKEEGLVEGEGSSIAIILSWQNHYSPKYERCYMQVTVLYTEKNSKLSYVYNEVYDAFEKKRLSMCSDSDKGYFCGIEDSGSPSDCNACRKFVKDRMEN